MIERLYEGLSIMLGGDAGIGRAEITGPEGLWPEETRAVARAIPERQAEFAAGRRAARSALAELGHPVRAIPVDGNRAPVWPEGLVGAITHDMGIAFAAVLPAGTALGVGIDLTEAAPLPGRTRYEILPHAREGLLGDLEARAGFSAKESLFKALYPHVGSHFGFDSACVAPDLEAGTFRIALTRPLGLFPQGKAWKGGVIRTGNTFLTAIRIESA